MPLYTRHMKYIIFLSIILSACGNSQSNEKSPTTITQCDSTVIKVVNSMSNPYFQGWGNSDLKIVLPPSKGEFSVLYTFTSQHFTVQYDWTVGGGCIQTITNI